MEQELIIKAIAEGAYAAGVMDVSDIPFDRNFYNACAANACGNFGKCWTCPPDVGNIDDLIASAKQYRRALVYQTVSNLEDSFDFEGMMEAGARHNELADRLSAAFVDQFTGRVLHLCAGGCRICERCGKKDNIPCRFPERALASMEAYGIAVSKVAQLCGMKYINGKDTVTYFGAFLFD